MRRLALLLLALPVLLPVPAAAKGGIQGVEQEFKAAIEKVSPAAVICVPSNVADEKKGSSSGVIISRDGYVLSDGDVGQVMKRDGNRLRPDKLQDEVDVRVPDLERGGFATYPAVVVSRMRMADTTLLRILAPPAGGFRECLPPDTSAHLRVGDFTFVAGNAFGMAQEAPPTLTAGVVSSLTALPVGDAGGAIEFVYTSAAVNPGVNGGPCVDIEGRLVGTVSTWLPAAPGEPYQFLGKVVPMDRIRAVYENVPGFEKLFGSPAPRRDGAKSSRALERVFRYMAGRAGPSVVSLEAKRKQPLDVKVPGQRGLTDLPRYLGPVSGVLVDEEGWIVTSLYNLTNIIELTMPGAKLQPPQQLATGLQAIESVTVFLPDGGKAEAQVVAHHGRLGIALLKAELPQGDGTTRVEPRTLEAAPEDAFEVGRFVLALGNPFGERGNADPLLTMGILAKQHAADAPVAWRGQWQTDAGVTDGNCGGALVDLEGRLLGILQIWQPTRHGRNSGIGFVVPWPDIVAALPGLKQGTSPGRGFLGVRWRPGANDPTLVEVVPDSPAAAAGFQPGDRIVAVDGRPTPTVREVQGALIFRWEDEPLVITIQRDGKSIEVEATLGARP